MGDGGQRRRNSQEQQRLREQQQRDERARWADLAKRVFRGRWPTPEGVDRDHRYQLDEDLANSAIDYCGRNLEIVEGPTRAPVQVQPASPPPLRRDVQRDESFYRQHLHLGYGCRHNQCRENREFDPFCLCHLETRRRIAYQAARRTLGTPAGLRNLGNTCYMNSYLQTLFHTLPIRRTLYEWRIPAPDRRDPNKRYALVKELRNLFARLQSTAESSVSPSAFVKTAGVNVALQQDAQEFQTLFLDWIDQVLAERPGEEKLQRLFKGRLRFSIRCRACRSESVGENDFYNFALQAKDVRDITESLRLFFANEQIDGYSCQTCGRRCVADKKVQLAKLPRFLNLHLLRYYFDRMLSAQRKLTHPVTFPKILDLRPFLTAEQIREWGEDGYRYELMAILIHLGGAQGGHYYARIRVATDGRWYTFNDERVTPYACDEVDTDTCDAYLLVYEKQRDVERNAQAPVVPQHVDVAEFALGGVWQVPELKKCYSGVGVDRFLSELEVRPESVILWLPTDWLADVARLLRDGPADRTIPAPDMSGHLCVHGRIANFRGLKAVDAAAAERLFDTLAVVPMPFFVDGSMFCAECASGTGGVTAEEFFWYD